MAPEMGMSHYALDAHTPAPLRACPLTNRRSNYRDPYGRILRYGGPWYKHIQAPSEYTTGPVVASDRLALHDVAARRLPPGRADL
jgi:hypothetical protein